MGRMLFFVSLATALNLSWLSQAHTQPADLAKLAPHLNLLNELSPQRRTNRFFINEQTALYGVQEGYVNVGRGNLTFLNRDLVTVGRIPVVAGRVYDSAAGDSGDFGPGWRFTLTETVVERSDGSWVYTDESGSAQTLLMTRQGFKPAHPSLSDIGSIKAKHGQIQLLMRSGWHKTFRRTGNGYQLSEVADANGNALVFEYRQGRLVKVQGDGRWIALQRHPDGTIASIADDQGRSVQYRYRDGQLHTVIDRGGQTWQMHYDDHRRLSQITDPLQQTALTAGYYADGKVLQAAIRGSANHYAYQGSTTTVTDSEQNGHRYTQHPAGLTASIVNGLGTVSTVTFDSALRATAVTLDGSVRHRFHYDNEGYLQQLSSPTDGEDHTYRYLLDWNHHKISEVTDPHQITYQFRYDTRGNLIRKYSPGGMTAYRYNRHGDVIEVKRPNLERIQFDYTDDGQISHRIDAQGVTQFDYSPSGELIQVTNPDGSRYRYHYNAYSLRTQSDVLGNVTDYGYDALGRLVKVSNPVAQIGYRHNEHNLITAIASPGDPSTEIAYDGLGNVVRYGTPEQSHRYRYDALGRFTQVLPSHGDAIEQRYAPDEADWRARADTRTAINLSPEHTASGVYGSYAEIFLGRSQAMKLSSARYEPSSKTLQAVTNLGFVEPDTGMRAVLSRSQMESKEQIGNPTAFNRPSNSFFLPPEFRSNNCYVACDMVDSTLSVDIGSITAGSFARFSLDSTSRDLTPTYNLVGGPTAPAALLEGCGAQVVWDMGDGNLFSRPVDTASGLGNGFVYTSRLSYLYPAVGNFLVSTISFCSCFGLISTALVAVTVTEPPCTDERRANHHRSGFTPNAPFSRFALSNLNKVNKGHFKIQLLDGADQRYYDLLVAGINRWNGSFAFGQTTWTNAFTFEEVSDRYRGEDELKLRAKTYHPNDPERGEAIPGGDTVWLDIGTSTITTAAHEFGHILGFPDAYTRISPLFGQDLECHEQDIMSTHKSTTSVKGYHGQVFAETY